MVSALDALAEYIVPFHWDNEIAALVRDAEAQLAEQQPRSTPPFRGPRDKLVDEIADALKQTPKDQVANDLKTQLPRSVACVKSASSDGSDCLSTSD